MAMYQVAKQLFAPTKFSMLSYTELLEKLSEHFAPKPMAVIQHCKFNSRVRTQGSAYLEKVCQLIAQNYVNWQSSVTSAIDYQTCCETD